LRKKLIKDGCIELRQLDLFHDFLDVQKQAQELSVNLICNTSLQHDK